MRVLTKIALTAFTLLLIAEYVPGIAITSVWSAIVAACVLGLLNVLVKPLVVILTIPVTVLTLGLFLFVINAAFFVLAAGVTSGFSVNGFIPALIGSMVLSLVGMLSNRILR